MRRKPQDTNDRENGRDKDVPHAELRPHRVVREKIRHGKTKRTNRDDTNQFKPDCDPRDPISSRPRANERPCRNTIDDRRDHRQRVGQRGLVKFRENLHDRPVAASASTPYTATRSRPTPEICTPTCPDIGTHSRRCADYRETNSSAVHHYRVPSPVSERHDGSKTRNNMQTHGTQS